MSGYTWLLLVAVVVMSSVNLIYMKQQKWKRALTAKEKVFATLPVTKKETLYFCIMLIANVGITVFCTCVYKDSSLLFLLKRLSLIVILWPIAWIDYKEYMIPNKLLVIGLIYRGCILVMEFLFERNVLLDTLISELIAAAILFFMCALILVVLKNSIGFGDVKLLIVMALFTGVTGVMNIIMVSMLILFVISVALLVVKKKTRTDGVPFAPSVLVGTIVSVVLFGA